MKTHSGRMLVGRRIVGLCLLALVVLGVTPLTAWAINSPDYIIDEDFVGGNGGVVDSSSTNYRSDDSIGALGVGDSNSTNYRTQSGATTTSDPNLLFSVDTSSISFGTLSVGSTATGTAQFSVTNYTSYGYTVQAHYTSSTNNALNTSFPLHNISHNHFFATPSTPTASSVGTEQFGFNLVANTSPVTFGTDPQQVPDNTFSFGAASTAYNQANLYDFPNTTDTTGDTIAQSTVSSGKTIFTMAFIANISASTPAGSYNAQQELICVGTY